MFDMVPMKFTDLDVWKHAHNLVIFIYKVVKRLPKEEKYSLGDQLKRSALSITSNIAEGFGRHSYREKLHFYYIAEGSLTELQNQIILTKDLNYINSSKYEDFQKQSERVYKILRGLIRKTKDYNY